MIFDLDGTLVDSARDLTNALNHTVSAYRGYKEFTMAEVKQLVGEGVTRLIEKALPEEHRDRADDARAHFLSDYEAHITEYTKPYSGIHEMLEQLSGCRKAVVSNKNEALSVRVLKNLDLFRHFDTVLGSDSVAATKPSPVPLLTVLERLGISADRCVMVGDSDLDMEAGRRAGVITCGVTWGFRARSVLERFEPNHIIDHPSELVQLFGTSC